MRIARGKREEHDQVQPVVFNSVEFGRRLRRARQVEDLSQEQLADCIGVRQSFLSDLERGVQGDLQANTLMLLCQALGVSADMLLGLPEQTPPRRPRQRKERAHDA